MGSAGAGRFSSRGGRGQRKPWAVGQVFWHTVYFEAALAIALFLFMTYGVYWLFASLVDSDVIFYKALEYLETRKWGVFASYLGVACIALYTGIARPVFVVVDTFILAATNIFLDRALIFGM